MKAKSIKSVLETATVKNATCFDNRYFSCGPSSDYKDSPHYFEFYLKYQNHLIVANDDYYVSKDSIPEGGAAVMLMTNANRGFILLGGKRSRLTYWTGDDIHSDVFPIAYTSDLENFITIEDVKKYLETNNYKPES